MELKQIRAVLESNICVNDGDCFYDCDTCNEARKTLKEFVEAEEQGLLIKLPCKIGDTVYEANIQRHMVSEYEVVSVVITNRYINFGWKLNKGIYSNVTGYRYDDIGKTVFLTREAAEEAIKRSACPKFGKFHCQICDQEYCKEALRGSASE